MASVAVAVEPRPRVPGIPARGVRARPFLQESVASIAGTACGRRARRTRRAGSTHTPRATRQAHQIAGGGPRRGTSDHAQRRASGVRMRARRRRLPTRGACQVLASSAAAVLTSSSRGGACARSSSEKSLRPCAVTGQPEAADDENQDEEEVQLARVGLESGDQGRVKGGGGALRDAQHGAARARVVRGFGGGGAHGLADDCEQRLWHLAGAQGQIPWQQRAGAGLQEALDDAVFQRVKRDHRQPAAGRQMLHRLRQHQRHFLKLPIDENP